MTTNNYLQENNFYRILNVGKGGWYLIGYKDGTQQKIHGKKNLNIIYNQLQYFSISPEVRQEKENYKTVANTVTKEETSMVDVSLVTEVQSIVPQVEELLDAELTEEGEIIVTNVVPSEQELQRDIINSQEKFIKFYSDYDHLLLLMDEVEEIIKQCQEIQLHSSSLDILYDNINSRIEALQKQEIIVTKQESVSLESDIIASANGTLNTIEKEYDLVDDDYTAVEELVDEIETIINTVQEYILDKGSSEKTRKALARANRLHQNYNQRLEELDEMEDAAEYNWEEDDDMFLNRIGAGDVEPEPEEGGAF